MMATFGCRTATVTIMPEFTPTPEMLELHKDKGEEDWQVYAWCVRDVISKKSGLPKIENVTFRDKIEYEKLMKGRKNKLVRGDRVFEYKGSKGTARDITEADKERDLERQESKVDK